MSVRSPDQDQYFLVKYHGSDSDLGVKVQQACAKVLMDMGIEGHITYRAASREALSLRVFLEVRKEVPPPVMKVVCVEFPEHPVDWTERVTDVAAKDAGNQ